MPVQSSLAQRDNFSGGSVVKPASHDAAWTLSLPSLRRDAIGVGAPAEGSVLVSPRLAVRLNRCSTIGALSASNPPTLLQRDDRLVASDPGAPSPTTDAWGGGPHRLHEGSGSCRAAEKARYEAATKSYSPGVPHELARVPSLTDVGDGQDRHKRRRPSGPEARAWPLLHARQWYSLRQLLAQTGTSLALPTI